MKQIRAEDSRNIDYEAKYNMRGKAFEQIYLGLSRSKLKTAKTFLLLATLGSPRALAISILLHIYQAVLGSFRKIAPCRIGKLEHKQ